MRARTLSASAAAFLVLSIPQSQAQPRYTLVSQNQEVAGSFGYSVASAGDVNNDGYDDVIVGAYEEDPAPSLSGAGRVYVYSGRTGAVLHVLTSPNEDAGSHFGYSVDGAGDVNNDGYSDIVVGANWEEPEAGPLNSGRAYVFSGATGSIVHQLLSPNSEEGGEFGHSVSGAGDVNNDGYDDVIVGAWNESPGASPDFSGRAYLFSGQTGLVLHALASPNEQSHGYFGISVSDVGDLNSDGFDETIVGAYREDHDPNPVDAGRAYVFDGVTGSVLHTLHSSAAQVNGRFGISVSGVEDINYDGVNEMVVGAYWEDPGTSPYHAGRAYVFNGDTGGLLYILTSPDEENGGYFGYSVSGAGDINDDGRGEVIVGAPREGPDDEGRVHIFVGATGTLFSPNAEANGQFGFSVAGAGDVNSDGYHDVIVGAYQENPDGSPLDAGRAYVFSPGVVLLSCYLDGGDLDLEWTPWTVDSSVWGYWIYGATNNTYFMPGLALPYEHRVATLPPTSTAWSSAAGVGDSTSNWAYLVIAVDQSGQEIYRSNRVGEWDYGAEIP